METIASCGGHTEPSRAKLQCENPWWYVSFYVDDMKSLNSIAFGVFRMEHAGLYDTGVNGDRVKWEISGFCEPDILADIIKI